jgi:two-component system, response regulator PdtaR
MTSALIFVNGPRPVSPLVADFGSAGVDVVAVVNQGNQLVHTVVQSAPDVVVFDDATLSDALFQLTRALALTAPCPVLVFTRDADATRLTQAMEAGVHAPVVNGYGAHRVAVLVQLAQARFRRDKAQADALADMTRRLEERKVVDRAKGILMHARQVSDDGAFEILRTASMHTNQRLGQVSQHIIESARHADCVNRAGQLRMLSQRLVKAYVLQLAQVQVAAQRQAVEESVLRIDANLAHLKKNVSPGVAGDLLTQATAAGAQLKHAVRGLPQGGRLLAIDGVAEHLLQAAERLTSHLEGAGAVAPLRVLNLAGRQRMLSQRYAKLALLGAVGDLATAPHWRTGLAETHTEFEHTLSHLAGLPLSSVDIREALDAATLGWQDMRHGALAVGHPAGRERVALASESLLAVFERLSGCYERSMQMLLG